MKKIKEEIKKLKREIWLLKSHTNFREREVDNSNKKTERK